MMREYKRYEEYKDSGIEWVSDIPKHWKTSKIKRLFHTKKEKYYSENPTVLSLTLNGLKVRDITNNEGQLASSYQGYHKVEPGDIVFNPMDLISGYVDCSKFNGVISPAYTILEKDLNANIDEKYFNKYFQYHYFNKIFFAFGSGVSFEHRWTLTDKNLKQIDIINPPKQEQQKIASFLDQKTAEIDKIINKKETLIDHLEKFKKSVITEAVTKGKLGDNYIDKNGKLVDKIDYKDSGVDWIGKIPKKWRLSKVKYEYNFFTGFTPSSRDDTYYNINGYDWLNISDIKNKYIYEAESKISDKAIREYRPKISKKNSLVFSFKLSIGKRAILKRNIYTNEALATFEKNDNNDIKYLYYIAPIFIPKNAKENIYGAKILNQRLINDAYLLKPSKKEQEKIASFLDRKTNKINYLVQKAKESIKKYKEYKKSLIFEAVTGKIDVREYDGKEVV